MNPTDQCSYCDHTFNTHDPITGFCLHEDCDCFAFDDDELTSFPLPQSER